MVRFARGYYRRFEGGPGGEDSWYFMGGEPPLGQHVLRDGTWIPLPGDGFGLADRLIDGDPDFDGPVSLPAGIPAL